MAPSSHPSSNRIVLSNPDRQADGETDQRETRHRNKDVPKNKIKKKKKKKFQFQRAGTNKPILEPSQKSAEKEKIK